MRDVGHRLLALALQGFQIPGHLVKGAGEFGHLAVPLEDGGAGAEVASRQAGRRPRHSGDGLRDPPRQQQTQ